MATDITTAPSKGLEQYVRDAIRAVGLKSAELTDEQRERALSAPTNRGGVRGKQLGLWIKDGETGNETVEREREQRRQVERAERTARHVTASRDPQAAGLAVAAKEFAGVKSPFGPGEARVFLDEFTVAIGGGGVVTVIHGDGDGAVSYDLIAEHVKAFAKGALEDADVKRTIRQAMSALGKDTVLWGRKLAALISVKVQG